MSLNHHKAKMFLQAAVQAHGDQPHGDLAAELRALRCALMAVEYIVRVLETDFIPESFTESEREEVSRARATLEYLNELEREMTG